MERHIDTRKGNSSKSTLEFDVSLALLQVLGLPEARVDNIAKHLLHLLDSELLRQLISYSVLYHSCAKSKAYLSNIDLLNLQVVEDIGDSLESDKFTSTNVLLTLYKTNIFRNIPKSGYKKYSLRH